MRGRSGWNADGVSTVITNIGELAGADEERWLVEDAALVIDGDRLVGIVTTTDLVRSLAEGLHDQEVGR